MKTLTDAPEQWRCDQCGEWIATPEHGLLEWWASPADGIAPLGFRIVHRADASPVGGCAHHDRTAQAIPAQLSLELPLLLGPTGLAAVYALLDYTHQRPAEPEELVEILCRLHVPHYEEVRHHPHADELTYKLAGRGRAFLDARSAFVASFRGFDVDAPHGRDPFTGIPRLPADADPADAAQSG